MQPEPANPEPDSRQGGLLGTVLRGAGLAGGGYVAAQAINLGVYIALSRLLTPSEFGQYAAATVLIGFGLLITESGMHAAIIQRRDRLEEAQSTAAVATLIGGVLLALMNLAVAPLLGVIFDSSEVTALAASASGLIFIHTLSVAPNAILQRRFSFVRMFVIGPIEVIVFGAVAIFAAANDIGPWAMLAGQYAGALMATTLAWSFARWRPRLALVSFAMWKELASYGRHVLLSTTIIRFGEQAADTVIVGRSLGSAALGQYRYAFRIASLPFAVMLAAAAYVIFPAFARIAAERDRLESAFLRSLRWMATIGIPAGMILIPLGPSLAVLVFGDVWEPAGYAAVAMCAYAGASCITSSVVELLKADGQPSGLTRINIVITVTTAATMIAMIPLGLTAIAAGLSAGAVAGAAYAVRSAVRRVGIPVRPMMKEIYPPLLASILMAAVVLPLDRYVLEPGSHGTVQGLLLLAAEGLLAVAVYAVAVSAISPSHPRELIGLVRSRGGRSGALGEGADTDLVEELESTLMD
ncbi:MAG: oligosaccharide flippase family protein [Solirubrobacterales bacterium]